MSDLHMMLSDKAIGRLAPAERSQYKVRDVDLKGYYILVGKHHRLGTSLCSRHNATQPKIVRTLRQ